MKILHVIDKSFVGGGQRVVSHLISVSRARGLEPELACRAGGPLVEQARALGAPVHLIPFDKRFRPGPARAVARLVEGRGMQIVHAHGLVATTYCTLARSLFGARAPLIYHQHGFHHHNYGSATVGLRKAAERAVSWRADRVVAASQQDAERVAEWRYAPPERILNIPYGIPDPAPTADEVAACRALARLPEVPAGPVVGCVARLHPQKGVDVLLRAMARLATRVPDATFVIVGTGELETELHALAAELGLGDRLRWVGSQPSVPFIRLFDVAVMSSHWEGMPLVLLEYMGSSRAIVTTDADGCTEAVGPREARIVARGDDAALADAIEGLLRDPARARALGAAARARFAERFTLTAMLERFMTVYRELAS